MKNTLYIPIIILLLTGFSCAKKQDNSQFPSHESPMFAENSDDEINNSNTGINLTDPTEPAPSPNEAKITPIEPIAVDFTNRKPFKFTITADIKAEQICYAAYVDDDGEQIYSCEQPQDLDVIKVLVVVQDVDGKFPILYDLDCESDGIYEFTGLTTPHAFCTYKNHSGKHQISIRGNIPGMILCTRKGDIQAENDHLDTDEFISMIPQRNDIPQYVNDAEFDVINKLLPDYFYNEPVNSMTGEMLSGKVWRFLPRSVKCLKKFQRIHLISKMSPICAGCSVMRRNLINL